VKMTGAYLADQDAMQFDVWLERNASR